MTRDRSARARLRRRLPDARQRRRGGGRRAGGAAARARPPASSSPAAFVTTVATRLAIDVLRSARVRREAYPGSWLPEPLVEEEATARVEDEEASRSRSSCCSSGSPPTSAPCSCCASRSTTRSARSRRSSARPRRTAARSSPARGAGSPTSARASTPTRSSAARSPRASSPPPASGDMDGLVALLAPDVVMAGDGGGKARAIPAPLHGAAQVGPRAQPVRPDGRRVGGHLRAGGRQRPARLPHATGPTAGSSTSSRSTSRAALVQRLYSILNPDKLGHLGPISDLGLRPVRATPPR